MTTHQYPVLGSRHPSRIARIPRANTSIKSSSGVQPKTKKAVFGCCWSSSLAYEVDSVVGCGGVVSLSILALWDTTIPSATTHKPRSCRILHLVWNQRWEPRGILGSDPSDHLGCTLWIWTLRPMRAVLAPRRLRWNYTLDYHQHYQATARTPGNGPRVLNRPCWIHCRSPFVENEL